MNAERACTVKSASRTKAIPQTQFPLRVKPSRLYDVYWQFAAERQSIFFKRINGVSQPWTDDAVMRMYKFTNAYRASDRVSQFLIKNVIYTGEQSPAEIFFRTLLFKFFNRIETWQLLLNKLGEISASTFLFERYNSVLTEALEQGKKIYSAAYIMPTGGPGFRYPRKHQLHLRLLEKMLADNLPGKLSKAASMEEAFELILAYPTIGSFLAYQFITDLNYSTMLDFSEMDFTMPGPGALRGIRKCFDDLGGLSEVGIINLMAERQETEFARLGLSFKTLWGRRLQLIDCQNLFCEVDKYTRVAYPESSAVTKTRIKQRYKLNSEKISYWYPPKWGLNDLILKRRDYASSI